MIPQERIHEQVREVRDKIAEETNPHGVDAALTIRALERAQPQSTCPCQMLRGREWVSLLIPSMRWLSNSEYQLQS